MNGPERVEFGEDGGVSWPHQPSAGHARAAPAIRSKPRGVYIRADIADANSDAVHDLRNQLIIANHAAGAWKKRADELDERCAEMLEALKNAQHAMRETTVPADDSGGGLRIPAVAYDHPLMRFVRATIAKAEGE